jgi:hypothetical protein
MEVIQRGATEVRTERDARALASRLNDANRTRPVVVVSRAAGQSAPYVDVEELVDALADLAEVHVIPTGDVSWAFSSAMPPHTQVYGGASRVYPVDLSWTSDPAESPLRFAFGPRDRDRVTELLISDAMGMALAAGLVEEQRLGKVQVASGRVLGTAGGRALVDTDRGVGTVWPELTVPDVAAERLFCKGMTLTGDLDPDSRRLDVRAALLPVTALLDEYAVGATVLGRVTRLDNGGCHLELVPGLRVFIDRRDAMADQSVPLGEFISVGEVVTAVVVAVGEATGKGWKLNLIDVDPDLEPHAAALLAGGPPWLKVPERVVLAETEREGVPTPATAQVDDSESLVEAGEARATGEELLTQFSAIRLERDGYLAELERARTRIERLEADRARLRTQAREAGNLADRRLRDAEALRGQVSMAANDDHLFADALDQFDFEVRLAWARRTTPDEKASLALAQYDVLDGFMQSLNDVDGISRQKVVDVVVDVLTGRVHDLDSRESHQLRVSDGGASRYVTREDGSTCWRVALQRNTAQARRLHFWQRPDGSVDLSAVRKHDDMRP